MAGFQLVPCTPEVLQLFGRENPAFYHSIRFEIENRLPLTKFTLYSYVTRDATHWYGFKKHETVTAEVYLTSKGNFDANEMKKGFEIFCGTVGLIPTRKLYYVVAEKKYTDAVKPFFPENDWEYQEYFSYIYVTTEEQHQLVKNVELPPLPEGYLYGDATLEDAEVITNTWKYSGKNELPQTRMKIEKLPSSRITFNGQTIGFEVLDPNGALSHLLVFEEHRGKGLGIHMQLQQMKKCIREGFLPWKMVDTDNVKIVEASDRSSYWTRSNNPDGTPQTQVYLVVWPKGTNYGE